LRKTSAITGKERTPLAGSERERVTLGVLGPFLTFNATKGPLITPPPGPR
jgi:hypothetical protein